ncbi:MAG: hypothetical protein GQ569_14320 [Methylococcaceae bacterium]|nr:hypothetical protein [Methylococcaceae bacterium]
MARNIQLVIIDPQNSFCNVVPEADQQRLHDGELCVAGGWDDMVRVGKLVTRLGNKLSDIKITMDSHQRLHIANPDWFCDCNGKHPAPFTLMRAENNSIIGSVLRVDANGQPVIENGAPVFDDVGEFRTVKQGMFKRSYEYLAELSANNRYPHCLWPPHCQIGTAGHNIVAPLYEALDKWCADFAGTIDITTKGSNPWVEHFSAVRAEVADPNDPNSQLNTEFIQTLMEADEILLSGEARSHCLANTVRDIANEFAAGGSLGSNDEFIKKCVLLTDATSDVPGFTHLGEAFVNEMTARGMKTSTCADYLI